MFYKRLEKALKNNFKTENEIVTYCKKETSKNYSDAKCHDMQVICEYLLYKIKNDCTFEEYQQIIFEQIWG